ncbi:MAG TPA: helix-turn-helix domain-containing protein, partial [Actinomycetes bacterium]|nr:helix-turn-helix domain-containing protein [Actinomycetes bacterium]
MTRELTMQTQNAHSDLDVSPPRDASGDAGSDRARILQFRVLGPLEVLHEGKPVGLGGPRDRALLALLVVNAGEVVSSDRLIEAVWGDDLPRDPHHALQAAVSRLRRALQLGRGKRGLLVRRPPGYLLDIEPEQVDAARFERLADAARRRQ